METNLEKSIARDLLSIGAVFLRPEQPFTWASGIKSPIYCDNRLTLTAPEVRKHVEAGLAEIVRTKYPEAEVLMGTSTAGIAHAAIAAHLLGLPMGYVRSSAKDHGRGNQIEGRLEPGQKVVVIEDLISTAGSVLEVVKVLREAGADVDVIAAYENVPSEENRDKVMEALEAGTLDCVTFGSSSTVRNFLASIPLDELKKHPGVRFAAIGPVTAETMRSLEPDIQSESFTIPAMVDAVCAAFAHKERA